MVTKSKAVNLVIAGLLVLPTLGGVAALQSNGPDIEKIEPDSMLIASAPSLEPKPLPSPRPGPGDNTTDGNSWGG